MIPQGVILVVRVVLVLKSAVLPGKSTGAPVKLGMEWISYSLEDGYILFVKPLLGKVITEAILYWARTQTCPILVDSSELANRISACLSGLPFLELVLFAFEMLTRSFSMTIDDIVVVLYVWAGLSKSSTRFFEVG